MIIIFNLSIYYKLGTTYIHLMAHHSSLTCTDAIAHMRKQAEESKRL